ncbi:hypothetical protein EDC04DRAFT_836032 [Pisolithus marmoratus]|nr:hypothetical protein EDC04DRAFT_836032 [Pisolithus marmoratus]
MSAISTGGRCSVSCAAVASSFHRDHDLQTYLPSSKSRTSLYNTSTSVLNRDALVACGAVAEHLAPNDAERSHDTSWKLELEGNSSTTLLLSRPVSPDHFSAQTHHDFEYASPRNSSRTPHHLGEGTRCSPYLLDKPGDRIGRHTQRLRLRTAEILQSLPATVEDMTDQLPPVTSPQEHFIQYGDQQRNGRGSLHSPRKLRRVSRQTNLRDKFCHGRPLHRDVTDTFVVDCNKPTSHPYLRFCTPALSSSDTLVESYASYYSAMLEKSKCKDSHSNLSSASSTQSSLSSSASHPHILSTRQDLHTSGVFSSSPLPHLHVRNSPSLLLVPCDEFGLVSVGGPLWSCAKITRSATKREARRTALRKKSPFVPWPSILIHGP